MRSFCFRYFVDRHEYHNELPVTFPFCCLTSKSLEDIISILITVYHSSFTLYEGNALPNATRSPLYELWIKEYLRMHYASFFPMICNDYRKMGQHKEPLIHNNLSLRQVNEQQLFLCLIYICSLLYLWSPTVLRFKHFCKGPMQSVCLYLQVRKCWVLHGETKLQIFSRTVDCNTFVSTAEGILKCCQKAAGFNFDFRGTPQLLHFCKPML